MLPLLRAGHWIAVGGVLGLGSHKVIISVAKVELTPCGDASDFQGFVNSRDDDDTDDDDDDDDDVETRGGGDARFPPPTFCC